MSGDLRERDTLADLVSRSLGTRIESVAAEALASRDGVERERLRFSTKDGERSVIFERSAPGAALEAQLLPLLARKTDRVPVVHARGLPPARARLGPWLLVEDALGATPACDGDVADVVAAKLAIERAVAGDGPALRGLGVPVDARPLPPALAAIPPALVHGDLRCAVAHRLRRGVVITAWARATIGCPVLDVAGLLRDLERGGRPTDAGRARDAYRDATGCGNEAIDEALRLLGALGER